LEEATVSSEVIQKDLTEMENRLKIYVDKGRVTGAVEVREEPAVTEKPDLLKFKSLKRMSSFDGQFLAVDCGTRTLKRANNWGIYLMRATYALVKDRNVNWGYQERLCTIVGDAHVRRSYLQDFRMGMESNIALRVLSNSSLRLYDVHEDVRRTYLLLDGSSNFGGERKFQVSLYQKCERDGVNLLAISKNSPSLHDEKGRDLIATTYTMAPGDTWVYYPVGKADKDKHQYGDISIVKLCRESLHAFRCDVMEYLTNREISELLSPLTCVAEDPRCVGYPIALWLAHDFSKPSDSMLLSYHDRVEDVLKEADLLGVLRREESCCGFADGLHGIKHAFEWEWWDGQF
jgi:hypothetical protein